VRKLLILPLLFTIVAFGNDSQKLPGHRDYVPNEDIAKHIAEAVLVGQFGQERVNAQLPLLAVSASKDVWLVQGKLKDTSGRTQVGGAFGVWINKHTGCLSVIEHVK
jgi:hypothetical protein